MNAPEDISSVVARLHGGLRVPGVAVAVVDHTGTIATGVSGTRALPHEDPVDIDTSFLWFSMTKIVTATVALRLADEGLLDLDEPVGDRLPKVATASVGKRVTARHLLSHTSGLKDPVPLRWVHAEGRPAPNLRAFTSRTLRKHRRLKSQPGATARYTNLGFLLLGTLLESVAGSDFEELVRSRVLGPLGMERTGFAYVDGNRALGHHAAGFAMGAILRAVIPSSIGMTRVGGFVRFDPFYVDGAPYGGLVGSVSDAARFLHAHISGGLVPDAARREMQTIQHGGTPFDTGLGWFRSSRTRDRYEDAVEHLGGGAGFFNVMRLDKRNGKGVVVMGNATRYDLDRIADDLLLGPS